MNSDLIKGVLIWMWFILGWMFTMAVSIALLVVILFFLIKFIGIDDEGIAALFTLFYCFVSCIIMIPIHYLYLSLWRV